jgi:hypothetical protein
MTVLLKDTSERQKKELEHSILVVAGLIEQDGKCWHENTDIAIQVAIAEIQKQIAMLSELYDPSDDEVLVVPDTNALLYAPHLDRWRFAEAPKFSVVLAPTVLSELDQLKMRPPQDPIRDVAKGLIRRIKDYRRRAHETGKSLLEGAVLKAGRSRIQALPIEPDFSKTLPWLDKDNDDDRILATLVEVACQRPHSVVVLVTQDINLQNKAEFASFPFLEPPEEGRQAIKKLP